MKKLFVLLCAFMSFIVIKGQGLGDYMEIDGVPGFVFYVDESGEHGLVMSFQSLSEKKVKKEEAKAIKTAKEMGLPEDGIKNSMAKLVMQKRSPKAKQRKEFYPELIKYLSEDGEQNSLAIIDFCKEKGIDLNENFPEFYWASQLGNGWFIPGENEATRFAEFYAGGVGKEHQMKGLSFYKRKKEISNDIRVQEQVFRIAYFSIFLSTMKNSNIGFFALSHYSKNGMSTANWFEINDVIVTGKAAAGLATIKNSAEKIAIKNPIVAIHKF